MTAPGDAIASVADELEALTARVDKAKAATMARAHASAHIAGPGQPATPIDGPVGGKRRSRRNLILVLALVLVPLGVAATVTIGGTDGRAHRIPSTTAAPGGMVASGRSAPIVTGVPDATSVSPVAADPVIQGTTPSTVSALAIPPPEDSAASGAASTVVVEGGDSFWSIAEHQVASARGRASGTTDVASYWAELVAANQGRLADAGNADMIYAGQTFALP